MPHLKIGDRLFTRR